VGTARRGHRDRVGKLLLAVALTMPLILIVSVYMVIQLGGANRTATV